MIICMYQAQQREGYHCFTESAAEEMEALFGLDTGYCEKLVVIRLIYIKIFKNGYTRDNTDKVMGDYMKRGSGTLFDRKAGYWFRGIAIFVLIAVFITTMGLHIAKNDKKHEIVDITDGLNKLQELINEKIEEADKKALESDNEYEDWQYVPPVMSLEERQIAMTSYEQTIEENRIDKEIIEDNNFDFSQMEIACLGDSLTAASNLENEENYEQYSYPSILKELLGARQVINLGIGGSTIGRYWSDPFVDRYKEIPQGTDIIIVMGGTNDGYCVSAEEFGSLDERMPGTYCGDVNELMKGLRENYPSSVIFFATPLPNVLHTHLMSERDGLLPQEYYADVIRTIAAEYDIKVIDLYNSNILDSCDSDVATHFTTDGVHGNQAGYQILAECFAAEIVEYYDRLI